jgi:pyruvate dehydrogenase E2 component (dihydrolipoamide acetyltransferase)
MEVRLPALSEGANSGTVVSILVSEGDQVEKDQTIIELENEKAIAPIPSTASGTVSQIHVSEGDTIAVGQVIITLDEGGRATEEAPTEGKKESQPESEVAPAGQEPRRKTAQTPVYEHGGDTSIIDPVSEYVYKSPSGYEPPASPSVRKLARDIGLDLYRIRGSARGGRIVLEDIKAYIQRLQQLAFAQSQRPQAQPEGQPAPAQPKAPKFDHEKWGAIRREKFSSTRKTIGQRMQQAWNLIPHVYQFDEADITRLMELREKYKEKYRKQGGNLTLTALAVRAVYETLQQFPIFNSSLDEEAGEIVYKEHYHIGIAVDTESGLVVPVLRDVDQKNLLQISQELQHLAEKARDRKLSGEEMQGSSFTISNLGGIGGTHFTPIVNLPNVAILGIGRGIQRVVPAGKKTETHTILPLCVSYDHRVIDGANGARFITELVKGLEEFDEKQVKI